MARLYCLKWNNHNDVMKEFKNFLSIGIMVDVTLACDGQSLKAHKLVLSACSPFFKYLFLENPCKHPIVILKDIKYSELKAIIDFMYNGEINVEEEQLPNLIKTAQTLRVSGLGEDLSRYDDPSPSESENLSEDESSDLSTCTVDVNETLRSKEPLSNQINIQHFEPEIKQDVMHDDMNNSGSCSKTLTIPLIPCDSELLKSQQVFEPRSNKRAVEENIQVSVKNFKGQSFASDYSNMQQHQKHVESSSSVFIETVTHESADVPVTDNQEPGTSTSSFKRARKKIEQEEQIPHQKSSRKIRCEEMQPSHNLKQTGENFNSINVEDKDSESGTGMGKFHKCNSCSFKTLYEKNLKRHCDRVHAVSGSQAKFQCNECTYTTACKSHLVQHLEADHQEKPYQCSLCTYKTANQSHLKKHVECVHEGKKPFQCKNCSFRASKKDVVSRHAKIHRKKK